MLCVNLDADFNAPFEVNPLGILGAIPEPTGDEFDGMPVALTLMVKNKQIPLSEVKRRGWKFGTPRQFLLSQDHYFPIEASGSVS